MLNRRQTIDLITVSAAVIVLLAGLKSYAPPDTAALVGVLVLWIGFSVWGVLLQIHDGTAPARLPEAEAYIEARAALPIHVMQVSQGLWTGFVAERVLAISFIVFSINFIPQIILRFIPFSVDGHRMRGLTGRGYWMQLLKLGGGLALGLVIRALRQ